MILQAELMSPCGHCHGRGGVQQQVGPQQAVVVPCPACQGRAWIGFPMEVRIVLVQDPLHPVRTPNRTDTRPTSTEPEPGL